MVQNNSSELACLPQAGSSEFRVKYIISIKLLSGPRRKPYHGI
jgi:hypothetical protein